MYIFNLMLKREQDWTTKNHQNISLLLDNRLEDLEGPLNDGFRKEGFLAWNI